MWKNPTCKEEIELALSVGQLFVKIGSGAWWQARRNGRTKLWKTRPTEFSIPIKIGFRNHDTIDENYPLQYLRIAETRKAAEEPA